MNPLSVTCPSCFAQPGQRCAWLSPKVDPETFHDARVDAFYLLNQGDQPIPAEMMEKIAGEFV